MTDKKTLGTERTLIVAWEEVNSWENLVEYRYNSNMILDVVMIVSMNILEFQLICKLSN